MKVTELIKRNERGTISVEVEPPTLGVGIDKLWEKLDEIVALGIHWVDITYHTEDVLGYDPAGKPICETLKPGTEMVATAILERYRDRKITVVPHVICTGFNARETQEYITALSYHPRINNFLALRGDPPKGPNKEFLPFVPKPGGYAHASDLIKQIADLRQGIYLNGKNGKLIDSDIGGACYPEGYQGKPVKDQLYWLRHNQDLGANYFTTQVFFDNESFLRFRDLAVRESITVPIIPGIQPLASLRYLDTMPPKFGCTVPEKLERKIREYAANPEEVQRIGVDWCIDQATQLQREGVPGLHFYANRQHSVIVDTIRALK